MYACVHVRGESNKAVFRHLFGTEHRSYEDQRRQPVNSFVATCFKKAVTQCRLSTVTQLLFLPPIYVDAFTKLGRNAPQADIVHETNPSCPRMVLTLNMW